MSLRNSFEQPNGVFDVAALILAENVERRNLKPEPEKGKRTDLSGNPDKLTRHISYTAAQRFMRAAKAADQQERSAA